MKNSERLFIYVLMALVGGLLLYVVSHLLSGIGGIVTKFGGQVQSDGSPDFWMAIVLWIALMCGAVLRRVARRFRQRHPQPPVIF